MHSIAWREGVLPHRATYYALDHHLRREAGVRRVRDHPPHMLLEGPDLPLRVRYVFRRCRRIELHSYRSQSFAEGFELIISEEVPNTEPSVPVNIENLEEELVKDFGVLFYRGLYGGKLYAS